METLQEQLNNVQSKLNAERELGGQKDNDKIAALEAQEAELTIQVAQHREQELETRVQEQVQTQGYLLDTLTASNGLTMAELSYSPENHELVCIAVQKKFLAQQDAFNASTNDLNSRLSISANQLLSELSLRDAVQQEKENLEKINFTLSIEKDDALQKRDNAVRQAEEMANELNLQADELKKLKEQLAGEAIPVAPLSAEEQEAKLITEINGKTIKVYGVKMKSDGFDNKEFTAIDVLTGATVENYNMYLTRITDDTNKPVKRFKEVSSEEAAQLQADFKTKKEEIAKLTEIPELEVIQDIAPIEAQPDTQDQVPSTDNGGNAEIQGDGAIHEVVEQPTEEVKPIDIPAIVPVTIEQHNALAARVEALEQKLA